MKTISRYIMTLALLLTAVGGAWAQTETLLTTITPTGKGSYSETTAGVVTVTPSNMRRYNVNYGWLWSGSGSGSGSVTVEAKEGYTITKCVFKQNDKDPVTITTSPFAITFDESGDCVQNDDMDGVTSIEVYGYAPAPAEPTVEVTTNAAEEGATFTEAKFQMPAFDATAEYELVRDMSIQMTATMGDGTDGVRYRVKKAQQGEGYEPADMDMMQVLALVAVNDGIEQKALTLDEDYFCRIYKLDEQGQPTGDPMTFATFTFEPGIYAVKAVAAQGSDYAGETALSNTFQLFQGYEITVPAGEYATYFKDEALYVENENAQLYTISSVTESEAVLSSQINKVAAYTPMLIFNKGTEANTFLLIPTTEQADEVTVAKEFKGSLTEGEIPASSAVTDYYALNGKAFVWVKYAIEIGANKCWLQISNQPAAARASSRAITRGLGGIDGTTGIDAIENVTIDNEGWYDLQGRKLQSAPNRKGIYIHNGKKVIVR